MIKTQTLNTFFKCLDTIHIKQTKGYLFIEKKHPFKMTLLYIKVLPFQNASQT